ncbi:MAG: MarR family transcriptional regulator, partial [Clostridia bacterium]|nr:MarR family transcriptional regulator [Clostridia bacterium]
MNKKRDELQNKVAFSIRNVNIMMRRLAEKSPAKKQVDSATGMHGYVMCYLSEHEGEDVFQRDVEKKFSIRRSTAT